MENNEIFLKAKTAIERFGKLHYCPGGLCACMGCVNRSGMSLEEYNIAKEMEEVKELIKIERKKRNLDKFMHD